MEALEKAMSYLANRPRSQKKVEEYLKSKGYEEEKIREAIVYLLDRKYINDVEYAYMYIRYGLKKGKSLFRIKYELASEGVSEFDIEDGIYMFEENESMTITQIERENAEKEAIKIFRDDEELSYEDKKKKLDKLARRLNAKGYSAGFITTILERYR